MLLAQEHWDMWETASPCSFFFWLPTIWDVYVGCVCWVIFCTFYGKSPWSHRCFGYFLGRFYHLYLILYPPFKGNFLTFAVRTGQPEGFFYPTSAVEILKNRQSKRSLPSVKPACLSRRTHMLRRWGHQHPKHGTRKKNWHLFFFEGPQKYTKGHDEIGLNW